MNIEKLKGIGTGVIIKASNGTAKYSLSDYAALSGTMQPVFNKLRQRLLNLYTKVREEYKKYYIAYKLATNFVDVQPQKKQLLLFLNMDYKEIKDPKGLCRDVTSVGHYGNGSVEISLTALNQIDDVMDLIRQSFEMHWQEDDVVEEIVI